ncbi:ornithine cyclodeaminase family protein [Streptomyces sp. KHY 26]|uniref:ornithine cyclodeaminase family protein n=1 Tax=Streptomyces sp. KHY 26 TaxID=3097359 RepID=UPI00376F3A9D
MIETLVIDQKDISEIISRVGKDALMDRVIDGLFDTFAASNGTQSQLTPRAGFVTGEDKTGVLEWMPFQDAGACVTIKTVSYAPHNPQAFGFPTILGTIARYDDETGRLVALSDGVLPTAIRTGAASAVATKLLASERSSVVGLVGNGAQSVTQIHAMTRVMPVEKVLLFDVDPKASQTFRERCPFLEAEVAVVSVEQLEAEADVICTATSVEVGQGPVLPGQQFRDHVHVNAIGSDLPGKIELPLSLLQSAAVFPDNLAQALREGECQQLQAEDVVLDIMALCADPSQAIPHKESRTVFDSTGFALEDHIMMDVILEFAGSYGLGTRVALEHFPVDAKNPYAGSVLDF